MKIFRRILIVLCVLLVTAYLGIAVTAFNRRPAGVVCRDVRLVIKDSLNAGFITRGEVIETLKRHNINPIGKPIDEVHTEILEEELVRNPLIDRVECYKTIGGDIAVEVYQRIPVLRVLPASAGDYYVDDKGTVMPPDTKCAARLPVVTGRVNEAFATGELYRFALFLQRNDFWGAQIEQINVLRDSNVELVPRVGNHIIYLGQLADYPRKLERTKLFYEKVLNRVGWEKYSRINVEFPNQIVCTRRDDKR
jgi:cell division protein FtsQ